LHETVITEQSTASILVLFRGLTLLQRNIEPSLYNHEAT